MLVVTDPARERPMRYALLPLLLLAGCTYVPLTNLGQCSAITNARACQEDPYVVRWDSDNPAPSGESQKTAR
jgi:hypothetical protein